MANWALIGADGSWVSGPLGTQPVAGEGQTVVAVPFGFPTSYTWDPSERGFVEVVAPTNVVSRLAYQRLFTQQERIAIRASSDPIVVDFRELAALPDTIDLADPDVMGGTRYLEQLNLIAAGRATTILAGSSPS